MFMCSPRLRRGNTLAGLFSQLEASVIAASKNNNEE